MQDPETSAPDEHPPVIVPLIPDPPKPTTPQAPPVPKGMRVWLLLQGTTLFGVLCIIVSFVFFGVFLFSDKEHLHEKVILWVGVGFFGFGAHLVSRQSVKNFVADFGRFIPWGKKDEPPGEGP